MANAPAMVGTGERGATRPEKRPRVVHVPVADIRLIDCGHAFPDPVRDGMLVPLEGEVAWLLPEGPKPHWRGRIISLVHVYVKAGDPDR